MHEARHYRGVITDADLNWLLLVQLDYLRERFGGFPWCMPGGGVQTDELPSAAAVRELQEETGLEIPVAELRPAGWFCRPYFRPHENPDRPGELLLLYGAIGNPDDPRLRPAPGETRQATFAPFDLQRFLSIPISGEGQEPFQPLAGQHWAWWARTAELALADQTRAALIWTYQDKSELARPPWPEKPPVPGRPQMATPIPRESKSS